jgi:hypothetical protein
MSASGSLLSAFTTATMRGSAFVKGSDASVHKPSLRVSASLLLTKRTMPGVA